MTQAQHAGLYIFVGTIAEFIKLADLFNILKKEKPDIKLVASGQNDLMQSDLLLQLQPKGPDVWLCPPQASASILRFGAWTIKAFWNSFRYFRRERKRGGAWKPQGIVVVHGDTVSTFVGALTAKANGFRVAHVEAGLRSFNLLRPFPEELTRILVSQLADFAFCPNAWAMGNLQKHKRLLKVDTKENTLIDSLKIATSAGRANPQNQYGKYFILVIHRQENLIDREFLTRIIPLMEEKAQSLPCIMIMHKPTVAALENFGLLSLVEKNPNFVCLPRQPYIDFTVLLQNCEFIVTDGGSNQEESYFLGKPCLVLRKETERKEGLGHNVLLSMKNFDTIQNFLAQYQSYTREPIALHESPSAKISKELLSAHLKGVNKLRKQPLLAP